MKVLKKVFFLFCFVGVDYHQPPPVRADGASQASIVRSQKEVTHTKSERNILELVKVCVLFVYMCVCVCVSGPFFPAPHETRLNMLVNLIPSIVSFYC